MDKLFESIYNEAKEAEEKDVESQETESTDTEKTSDDKADDKKDAKKSDVKEEPEKKDSKVGGLIDKAKKVVGGVLKDPTVKQIATTVAVGAVNGALRNKGISTGRMGGGYYGGAASFGMY